MTLTGQQVIDAAAMYPPIIVGHCYDSADILAGAYPELRSVEGIRSAELPGTGESRQVAHGWCIRRDGTIIDAVFAEEVANDPGLDPAAIQVTYSEQALPDVPRSGRPGALQHEIWKRARAERPRLDSRQRRWKFVVKQRDEFRQWLKDNGVLTS